MLITCHPWALWPYIESKQVKRTVIEAWRAHHWGNEVRGEHELCTIDWEVGVRKFWQIKINSLAHSTGSWLKHRKEISMTEKLGISRKVRWNLWCTYWSNQNRWSVNSGCLRGIKKVFKVLKSTCLRKPQVLWSRSGSKDALRESCLLGIRSLYETTGNQSHAYLRVVTFRCSITPQW